MILLEDSRQQAGKHDKKNNYFIKNGVIINRCTLTCGDYQIAGDSSRAIDTKKDIHELIGDIQVKVIGKQEIRKSLMDIAEAEKLPMRFVAQMFNAITLPDGDRFPEAEITTLCHDWGVEHLTESMKQLYVKRHGFFHRGLVRAKNYGIKLYILVENEDGVTDIRSLFKWCNPRRMIMVNTKDVIGRYKNGKPKYAKKQKYPYAMMGAQIAKACLSMEKKYGVSFVFCRPEESGKLIIELLSGKYNEA